MLFMKTFGYLLDFSLQIMKIICIITYHVLSYIITMYILHHLLANGYAARVKETYKNMKLLKHTQRQVQLKYIW